MDISATGFVFKKDWMRKVKKRIDKTVRIPWEKKKCFENLRNKNAVNSHLFGYETYPFI